MIKQGDRHMWVHYIIVNICVCLKTYTIRSYFKEWMNGESPAIFCFVLQPLFFLKRSDSSMTWRSSSFQGPRCTHPREFKHLLWWQLISNMLPPLPNQPALNWPCHLPPHPLSLLCQHCHCLPSPLSRNLSTAFASFLPSFPRPGSHMTATWYFATWLRRTTLLSILTAPALSEASAPHTQIAALAS